MKKAYRLDNRYFGGIIELFPDFLFEELGESCGDCGVDINQVVFGAVVGDAVESHHAQSS